MLGHQPGHGLRLWVESLDDGAPAPISPEGIQATQWAVSPDGKQVAAVQSDHKGYLFSIAGGDARSISGFPDGAVPIGWTTDGHSLFIYLPGELPANVYRLDLATGQKQLWKALVPADTAGITDIGPILIAADGKAYVYEYGRTLSDLFLVEGVK